MYRGLSVGVVIPALNEERSIPTVINNLYALVHKEKRVIDQIVVCDNGSTDSTTEVVKRLGAELVFQPIKGYGIACLSALEGMDKVDVVLFINADGAEKVSQSLLLFEDIFLGADQVVGSRVLGKSELGAMYLHQRLGTGLAVLLINKIWQQQLTDLGPFRAIRWEVLQQLNMQDKTFGWIVEMQIKVIQQGFISKEVPVETHKSMGRSKVSGTISGTIGAAKKMIGTILYFAYLEFLQKH